MAGETVSAQQVENEYSKLTRNDFDGLVGDFVFGTGTSAYQHEGGAAKGGRGISIWDAFTLMTPGRIHDGSNGNDAADMYTRYEEDIKMMKNMGFDAYRFSISWPRILPGGRICMGVNKEGIDYYNNLINTLLAHKMKPYVTLFHWDLPYTLEQEYEGFSSKKIADDFREFAELCFWKFGDRVKHWVTLNEPWVYAVHGYVRRIFPPGKDDGSGSTADADSASASASVSRATRNLLSALPMASAHEILGQVSNRFSAKTKKNIVAYKGSPSIFTTDIHDSIMREAGGVSLQHGSLSDQSAPKSAKHDGSDQSKPRPAEEAYIVAKNLLLAHAKAVETYRTKFQKHQKGKIGITLNTHWFKPFDCKDEEDKKAAKRALDFKLGWFLEPVLHGDYPESMKEYASKNIARALFSENESKLLREFGIDFLGLNYYTANYAKNDSNPDDKEGYFKDQKIEFLVEKDGKEIGGRTAAPWLYICPWGIKELLLHIDKKYANQKYKLREIYITENGMCEKNDHRLTPYEACADGKRADYHRDHLGNILDAMKVMITKVKGYFAWSWCDDFEWNYGYTMRFGIIYIDYKNNLTRHPKHSAAWFSKFLVREEGKGKQEKVKEGKEEKDDDDAKKKEEKEKKELGETKCS